MANTLVSARAQLTYAAPIARTDRPAEAFLAREGTQLQCELPILGVEATPVGVPTLNT